MNGRTIFKKYEKPIRMLIKLTRLLPISIRKYLLAFCRNGSSRFSMFVRYLLVSSLAKNVGINVSIFPGVFFENIENLTIGNNVSIHQMCYIDAEGGVRIGDDVSIAHRSTILSSNHGYKRKDISIKYQEMKLAKTIINNNVWIGCGCAILAGVEIGTGSIIGANSTVTKFIAPNCIVAGSPAKIIKKRF